MIILKLLVKFVEFYNYKYEQLALEELALEELALEELA